MKRIISFVLALTMILTFCACGAPGKLKPYLNGLQLGADATDMRKIASSLNEAGTINVNGIDFDLVYELNQFVQSFAGDICAFAYGEKSVN